MAEVNKVVRVVEVIEVIRVVEVIKVVELVERKNKRLPHFKREAASKFLHLGSRSEGRKARRADFPSIIYYNRSINKLKTSFLD